MGFLDVVLTRLKLAVKDALKSTAFNAVDDMLLKLYYLYKKIAPKMSRV